MSSLIRIVCENGATASQVFEEAAEALNGHLDKSFGIQPINPSEGIYCVLSDAENAVELLRTVRNIKQVIGYSNETIKPASLGDRNGS
jgi:hypothetical protein